MASKDYSAIEAVLLGDRPVIPRKTTTASSAIDATVVSSLSRDHKRFSIPAKEEASTYLCHMWCNLPAMICVPYAQKTWRALPGNRESR